MKKNGTSCMRQGTSVHEVVTFIMKREHFTMFRPLEGDLRWHFIMFYVPGGHPRGHFQSVFPNMGSQGTTVSLPVHIL